MSISESLLPEFDHEMSTARRVLERVPDDLFGWKPHVKSMRMGDLAVHLTEIPGWIIPTVKQESFDISPVGGEPYQRTIPKTNAEILEKFDRTVASARAAIEETSDDVWPGTWALLAGGKEVFSMPRIAVYRTMLMNHLIHHRAQLGVYLRLNDIAVPMSYGPSADERPEGFPGPG